MALVSPHSSLATPIKGSLSMVGCMARANIHGWMALITLVDLCATISQVAG